MPNYNTLLHITRNYLFENRSDFIAKSLGTKLVDAIKRDSAAAKKKDEWTPSDVVAELASMDPTHNQSLLQWVANRYVAGDFRIEDAPRVRKALETFDQVKKKLTNKDIGQFKHLSDLEDEVEKHVDTPEVKSAKQQAREIKDGGVKKIIDTPNFKVLEVLNQEAACYYGKGTKWCTAADDNNMFEHYSKDLYIIIAGTGENQRKFQMHPTSDQFMDEKDRPVGKSDIALLSKYPEYKDFLNMMIHKFYDPLLEE